MFGRRRALDPALMYGGMSDDILRNRELNARTWERMNRNAPEVFMPFDEITAMQRTVNDDFLDAAARNATGLPIFARHGGRTYLIDGYHRGAREAAYGASGMRGRLYDLDA